MPQPPVIVYRSQGDLAAPDPLRKYVEGERATLVTSRDSAEVVALVNRGHPALIVLDARDDIDEICELVATLKGDPFSAIVPVIVWGNRTAIDDIERAFGAGADEFLDDEMSDREKMLRLGTIVRRAERAVGVHPTTRLPGTAMIERDITSRLAAGETFAVCYADIDHFKEFNDRYSYNHGDRVILLVSKILRDVVKGHAPGGFIGHIGGDDFIFNVPIEQFEICSREVISIFDTLIPFQYTPEDRKAGFFWGKDRRGQLHRIPLMTLSIGIVTNEHRNFTHTAQVGELATEMKAYAKTKEGSIYVVDRRRSERNSIGGSESKGTEREEARKRS